jgi:hypothetical protein
MDLDQLDEAVDAVVSDTAVRFKFRSGRVGVGASRAAGAAADFGVEQGLFGA